jgi:rhodanese-related sulfurtransferase
MSVPTVTPRRLAELRAGGETCDLIDVRTPVEFRAVHAEGAESVPLDRLDPATLRGAGPVFVICQSGGRGRQACEKLLAAGLPHVANVEGGTRAWADAGLPVVRGKAAVSLERQVRIAAGALVLLGTALGWLADPVFLGLAAFVGAGLVVAGVTDTCGMGLVLARMPWNRVRDAGPTCATR